MKKELSLIKEYNDEAIYFKSPEYVKVEFEAIFRHKKEFFVCFYLDSRNKVIAREIISIGTLNSSLVHPREVFKSAIVRSANSIILAHNHPSGSLEPSDEDLKVTKILKECGELLGINLLDHVIVTEKGYKSIIDEAV